MAPPLTATLTFDRLGDVLVRDGQITRDQLATAQREQKQNGGTVNYHLVKLGYVQEIELTKMLARQYRMPAVDLVEVRGRPQDRSS